MKKSLVVLMTVVLTVMLAGCSTMYIDDTGGRDGSSFQKAVIVGSVRAEYKYIDRTFAGSNILSQVLRENDGKPYDIVSIKQGNGQERNVYFDISKFYRKKTYPDDLE
jgi:uncharacterized protein YxeA